MKLIKTNKVVKLPKATTSVERTLNRAIQSSKEQRWRKIIIIGEGPYGAHFSHSKMKYYDILGFIEWNKKVILDEIAEE